MKKEKVHIKIRALVNKAKRIAVACIPDISPGYNFTLEYAGVGKILGDKDTAGFENAVKLVEEDKIEKANKEITMKTPILIAVFVICVTSLYAQDMFETRRLTFDPTQQGFATWSPDGKFIIYQHSDRYDTTGTNGLWRISPDGTGAKQIFNGLAEFDIFPKCQYGLLLQLYSIQEYRF